MGFLPSNWLGFPVKIFPSSNSMTNRFDHFPIPIGSMYGIYANIGGILMVNVTIYIAYMDPMGYISISMLSDHPAPNGSQSLGSLGLAGGDSQRLWSLQRKLAKMSRVDPPSKKDTIEL